MEAGCYCDLGYDPITVHSHTNPTARKDHKCGECGADILKGEKYHVHTGRCDDHWFRLKNCEQCEQIRDDYGCGIFGDLDMVIKECLGIGINQDPEDIDA